MDTMDKLIFFHINFVILFLNSNIVKFTKILNGNIISQYFYDLYKHLSALNMNPEKT